MEVPADKDATLRFKYQADDQYNARHYADAIPLYRKALQIGDKQMPVDERADALETLALCYFHLKNYDNAAKYNKAALLILEASAHYGAQHEDAVRVRYGLARALSAVSASDLESTKMREEAVVLHEKNLEIFKANDGDFDVEETEQSLASVLVKLSRYAEAKQIYKKLLMAREGKAKNFIKDRNSLELKHNYAGVLYHLECYEESKQLLLQIQEAVSSLVESKQREFDFLTQSVDRYLAACIEATGDVSLGVSRIVLHVQKRRNEPSKSVKDTFADLSLPASTSETAKAPSSRAVSIRTETSNHDSPTVSRAIELQGSDKSLMPSTVKAPILRLRPIPSSDSQLNRDRLPSQPVVVHKIRRATSDQPLAQHKKETQPDLSAMRSKSTQATPQASEAVSGRASALVAKRNQDATVDTVSAKTQSSTSRSLRLPGPSLGPDVAPSTSRSSKPSAPTTSTSTAGATKTGITARRDTRVVTDSPSSPVPRPRSAESSKDRPSQDHLPSGIRDAHNQSLSLRLPGSWPSESSLPTNSTRRTNIASANPSSDGTDISLNVFKDPVVRSAPPVSGDSGQAFALPPQANDADKWFYQVRVHTHDLLYNSILKNPGRKPIRVAILDSGLAFTRDNVKLPMADKWLRKLRAGHLMYKDFTGGNTIFDDSSDNLHGTWCAAFVLQMAPHADVYIANVFKPGCTGPEPGHVAAAIAWAIENDVDIISMSFGWESVKPEVDAQIDLARQKGILLFAAASNDSDFTPEHGMYPASNQTVYCIYSCRGSGLKSEFNPRSSKDKISFMFPGEDVTILGARHKPIEGIGRLNGTSFATPVAAGTAAMVLDLARLELKDSVEVEWRLKKYEGMSDIFQAMSGNVRDEGYYHVRPWTLLGEEKPIPSPHNVNETHQWFTLMNVLRKLRRFGEYKKPLS